MKLMALNVNKSFISDTKLSTVKTIIKRENIDVFGIIEPTCSKSEPTPNITGYTAVSIDEHRLIVYIKDKLVKELKWHRNIKNNGGSACPTETPTIILEGKNTIMVFIYSEFSEDKLKNLDNVPLNGKQKQKKKKLDALERLKEPERLAKFERTINYLSSIDKSKNLIVMGDVNYRYKTPHAARAVEIIRSYGLHNWIEKPTRITKSSSTIIDWCFTKGLAPATYLREGPGDHKAVIANLWHKRDWNDEIFKNMEYKYVDKYIWSPYTEDEMEADPIESYKDNTILGKNCRLIKYLEYYREHFCTKKVRVPTGNECPQWMTTNVVDKYNKWQNAKGRDRSWKKSCFLAAMTGARRNYFRKERRKAGHPWEKQEIKPISQLDEDKDFLPNGKTTSEPEMAGAFREKFLTQVMDTVKAAGDTENMEEVINISREKYSNLEEWSIPETCEEEVNDMLAKLTNSTAKSVDGIPMVMFKHARNHISETLAQIINISIKEGHWIQDWREAFGVPLWKNKPENLRTDIKKYRLIVLSHAVGKLVARYVRIKMEKQIEDLNIFPDSMYGFRAGRDCGGCIRRVTDYMKKATAERNKFMIIALDFSSAFDLLPHRLIVGTLKAMKASDIALQWVEEFLRDRQIKIRLGSARSGEWSPGEGKRGSGQGESISPLFWNIAMVTLINYIEETTGIDFEASIFADDSALGVKAKKINECQEKAQKVVDAFARWSLLTSIPLSLPKTEILANFVLSTTIKIGGSEFNKTEVIKFLGVKINAKNKAGDHVEEVVRKINDKTYLTCKRNRGHRLKERKILFQGVLESQAFYGAEGWITSANKGDLNRIQTALNGGIRAIMGLTKKQFTDSHGDPISLTKIRSQLMLKSIHQHRDEWNVRIAYEMYGNNSDDTKDPRDTKGVFRQVFLDNKLHHFRNAKEIKRDLQIKWRKSNLINLKLTPTKAYYKAKELYLGQKRKRKVQHKTPGQAAGQMESPQAEGSGHATSTKIKTETVNKKITSTFIQPIASTEIGAEAVKINNTNKITTIGPIKHELPQTNNFEPITANSLSTEITNNNKEHAELLRATLEVGGAGAIYSLEGNKLKIKSLNSIQGLDLDISVDSNESILEELEARNWRTFQVTNSQINIEDLDSSRVWQEKANLEILFNNKIICPNNHSGRHLSYRLKMKPRKPVMGSDVINEDIPAHVWELLNRGEAGKLDLLDVAVSEIEILAEDQKKLARSSSQAEVEKAISKLCSLLAFKRYVVGLKSFIQHTQTEDKEVKIHAKNITDILYIWDKRPCRVINHTRHDRHTTRILKNLGPEATITKDQWTTTLQWRDLNIMTMNCRAIEQQNDR